MTSGRPRITISSSDRYTALRRAPSWEYDLVRHATVLVAGAGALGNEILKNLALLGIGRVLLVDFDRVEVSNLSRSILFREANAGQSKAETAANAVRAINPDVAIKTINGDIAWEVGWGIFRRVDVAIGALDNRLARVALNQHCWRAGTPWVDGALAESAGAVRVFRPPESACYECTLSDADYREMSLRFSCQGLAVRGAMEGKIPTTPTMASIIGAMEVQEALNLIHRRPVLSGREIVYDAVRHTMQTVELRRRDNCLGHSTLGHVVEEPAFRAGVTTAAQLLARARADLGPGARIELDREIVVGLQCPSGHERPWVLVPRFRLDDRDIACTVCGAECAVGSTHVMDAVSPHLGATLAEWGLPACHIVRARNGGEVMYYELTGDVGEFLPVPPAEGTTSCLT